MVLDIHMQKNEIEPLYHYIHTKKLKICWRLEHKIWNYKTPRKYKRKLHDVGLGDDFLDMLPKAQATKAKNK